MNKIVALIVFLVVSGGMYFVCANSHIDIFPCEIAKREPAMNETAAEAPLRTTTGMCSLYYHNLGTNSYGEHHRFTITGWALLLAFCGGIGLAVGGLAGYLTRKRS
jgi:hypothetical protein